MAKLNFQVLRRTTATLAQTKGNVKDVQGILGHTKADTTVKVYMQPIEEGVKQTLDANLCGVDGGCEAGSGRVNLVRFGTVGFFGRRASGRL